MVGFEAADEDLPPTKVKVSSWNEEKESWAEVAHCNGLDYQDRDGTSVALMRIPASHTRAMKFDFVQ